MKIYYKSEKGQGSAEYALIVLLLALGSVYVLSSLGDKVNLIFYERLTGIIEALKYR